MKNGKVQSRSIPTAVRRNLPVAQLAPKIMGGDAWRLPSGKALSEFALHAGFLAPLLLRADTARTARRTPIMFPEIREAL